MTDKHIGIIGSGIAGMTCGYYLTKAGFRVTMLEAEDYVGGHTHTVDASYRDEAARIDTGFIVYNDHTYPNFIKLMKELHVATQPTEMSFSVRNDSLDLEYNGHNLNTLFAQRKNLLRPSFLKMIKDILFFNKDVRLTADLDKEMTIGGYLEQRSFSPLFKDNYLLPMISAIWSMGLDSCLDFPLHFFVRFFENHGLLDVADRPQWHTIIGGSSTYIEPLTANFNDSIITDSRVEKVEREADNIRVHVEGGKQFTFDEVIFACHGDQALRMIDQPTKREEQILSQFSFSDNDVILHVDTSHLPQRKLAWASWNYRMIDAASEQTILTYNMNILQRLQKEHTYLVSLNQEIDPQYILSSYHYTHPIYTPSMIKAQQQWDEISGLDRLHFCGAYWFNGFHEDGVKSGLRVCTMLEEGI